MIRISAKIAALEESATLAISAKAKALKAVGKDILSFSAGEPDFDTPKNIKDAAVRAIEEGHTKYTPVGGIPELKNAIIEKFRKDNGLNYSPDEILVSCGGKHSLFNLFESILDPGDVVIVPGPYWVSYPPMIMMAGGVAKIIEAEEENDFKITPKEVEDAVTEETRAIVINSPSNPTGMVYSKEELTAVVNTALDNNLLVITDDIYEKLYYGDEPIITAASVSKKARENTVVLNGVSKAYSMTGWRIGYAAGPREIIAAMGKVQSQSTSNPASISQWAALEAISGDQSGSVEMVKAFKKRRDLMVDGLNAIDGVHCLKPEGAFYVFPKVSALYGKHAEGHSVNGSADMANYLLDTALVAVVPGEPFGDDACLRLSYASSEDDIEKGLKRIKEALAKLK